MNKMTTLTHRNSDNASQLAYSGATDFNGVRNQEYALTYNESGSLVSDAGRNIANIEYDNQNNPIRIQFANGNVTKYIYSAAGEKLRVIYQTAVPNISVAIGSTRELTPSETLYTDSIDYRLGGALTLRNGRIDKYQFDEGYCQVSSSTSTTDTFILFYYDKDHLGNVRQVTELDGSRGGNVIQRNNYYPFGAEFCDGNANTSVQSRKYNGKEFDNMHGLNTYDYGARQYNPVTARWDRVDPLAHEYYGVSPYVYCANNPMRYIDLDGRWYWENNGNLHAEENDNTKTMADFLGTTQKNVIEILGRSNISVGKNGKINVKNLTDLSLNKSSLYVMKADKSGIVLESKSIESNPYIDGFNLPQSPTQTELAVAHYFLGNGEAADVGDKATALLMNTQRFKDNLNATTTTKKDSHEFSVDMTDLVFHIGRTPVNYTVHHGSTSSHVDFRLFQYQSGKMDSFSDPLDVRIELPGGTKYNYKLRTVTYYFKPVK